MVTSYVSDNVMRRRVKSTVLRGVKPRADGAKKYSAAEAAAASDETAGAIAAG
jgi:inactivated superfamily I helicase